MTTNKCKWTEYNISGTYNTCKHDFVMWGGPDKTLAGISYKYCPYCGKEIEEILNQCFNGCGNIGYYKSPLGGMFCEECKDNAETMGIAPDDFKFTELIK